MATKTRRRSGSIARWGEHDHEVLVLQGGGALGAYQAGAYAALHDAGMEPDWVAGVSIGAINAALIAGNLSKQRVERLTEFWHRVSQFSPPALPAGFESMRPLMNRMSTASAIAFGVPGFFNPRPVPPFFAPDGSFGALSFYDTTPLKETLEELVDFDLINREQVRLSLGAVNLRNGNSVYFDNSKMRIGPEHVLASGALPPGFPPVEIEGELYWDGGIVSNSPLTYVSDESPTMSALIFQVDVFSGAGQLPENLAQVAERAKDIQYASKTRFNTDRIKQHEVLRDALNRVLDKLPPKMRNDPDVKALREVSKRGKVSLVHVINRHALRTSQYKDCEFSRATVTDLWNAGLSDLQRLLTTDDASLRVTQMGKALRVYELLNKPQ
ncbi:MAG: patatin-like phospholipase family protein [Burkholderiaceae bacterium]